MYCNNCGSVIAAQAVICVKCGVSTGRGAVGGGATKTTSRTTYVLLGLLCGGFGIHNFVAGYVGRGIAQLVIAIVGSIFTIGLALCPLYIWSLIEVCIVKKDANGVPFS